MAEILQRKKFKCAFCGGTGIQPRSLKNRCFPCRGKGEIGFEDSAVTCPLCKGKGRSPGALGLACIRCKGVGVIEKRSLDSVRDKEAVDVLGERLGEIAKRFSWMRKETEKKTKELKKRLKPINPFVKKLKKRNTMARGIRKQDKEGLAIFLGRLAEGAVKGISRRLDKVGLWPDKVGRRLDKVGLWPDKVGGLLGLAAKLEKEGKDEYAEQGEIKGKTKSGKEYKGAYGFRVKVGLPVRSQEAKAGLNLEDFKGRKKLSNGSNGSI